MTALELQTNKQNLIDSILSIEDADTIEKVMKYVRRVHKPIPKKASETSPLAMSDAEFRDNVIQSTRNFRNGGKTYTQDDIRNITNL